MRKIWIYFVLFVLSQIAYGQQLPQFSQYLLNDFVYNPAVAGSRNHFNVNLSSRYQWVGVNDAPRTVLASLNGPLPGEKMGVGGYMFADITGPTRRTGFSLAYAYHLKISNDIKLSFGINGGLIQYTVDAAKINLVDQADIALSNGIQSVLAPDAGAGLYLYGDKFFVSASVPQILGNKLQFFDDYAQTLSRLARHYFLFGGYRFDVGSSFVIEPSAMFKYIDPFFQFEGTVRVVYNDMIWLGANYRHEDAVGAMIGYSFLKNFNIAYTYDFPINGFDRLNVASHELIAGFKFLERKKKY